MEPPTLPMSPWELDDFTCVSVSVPAMSRFPGVSVR